MWDHASYPSTFLTYLYVHYGKGNREEWIEREMLSLPSFCYRKTAAVRPLNWGFRAQRCLKTFYRDAVAGRREMGCIELSTDLLNLNGFKMDRLKLFFPVRQSDDECGEKGKMELSSCSSRGPVSSLASSNAARVYRVSTQFPLSLQVLRTHYRD